MTKTYMSTLKIKKGSYVWCLAQIKDCVWEIIAVPPTSDEHKEKKEKFKANMLSPLKAKSMKSTSNRGKEE